jgi:hypothetical protein
MEQQQKENRQLNTGSAQMLASIGETTTNNAEEKSPQVENGQSFLSCAVILFISPGFWLSISDNYPSICFKKYVQNVKQSNQSLFHQNRLIDDPRKSASLQMLAHGDGVLPPTNSPVNEMNNEEMETIKNAFAIAEAARAKLPRQQTVGSTIDWHTSERIGGKISAELANESSANNSGRGSRSSGLQVYLLILIHLFF